MVREKLLLDELLSDVCLVLGEGWVVVVVDALVSVAARTLENASSWDTFGADAMAEVDVYGGITFGGGDVSQSFQGRERAVPVPMGCGVLAA